MSTGGGDERDAKRPRLGDGEKPAAAPTQSGEEKDDICCWLCHGEGPDDDGQPLRRDCSCRGGSGFAHLSCIVDYAKHTSENWDGEDLSSRGHFCRPWIDCPHCHQRYQGELRIELATAFASFAEESYPDDKPRLLAALENKVRVCANTGILGMMNKHHGEDAKQIGYRIISLIDEMRAASNFPLPNRIMSIEACTYNSLGCIATRERADEGDKEALEFFEKYLDLCNQMGDKEGAAVAKNNMSALRGGEKYEDIEEQRQQYKRHVAQNGEGSRVAIEWGIGLSQILENANRVIEAERLAMKLLGACKRVHGAGHLLTKEVEERVEESKERWVRIKERSDFFVALRYDDGGNMCVVQGPRPTKQDSGKYNETTFSVASDEIVPAWGTPVVCRGVKEDLAHLNGKVGEARSRPREGDCTTVHFEDASIEPQSVEGKYLRILFNLPEGENVGQG